MELGVRLLRNDSVEVVRERRFIELGERLLVFVRDLEIPEHHVGDARELFDDGRVRDGCAVDPPDLCHRRLVVEPIVERDVELLGERVQGHVVRVDQLPAELGDQAPWELAARRERPPSDAVRGLVHGDIDPCLVQPMRAVQPGEARPDDDHARPGIVRERRPGTPREHAARRGQRSELEKLPAGDPQRLVALRESRRGEATQLAKENRTGHGGRHDSRKGRPPAIALTRSRFLAHCPNEPSPVDP